MESYAIFKAINLIIGSNILIATIFQNPQYRSVLFIDNNIKNSYNANDINVQIQNLLKYANEN